MEKTVEQIEKYMNKKFRNQKNQVKVRKILNLDKYRICADCGENAHFEVEEPDGEIWYYCGVCGIGG